MKITKKLIGKLFPITKLPKNYVAKGYNLIIGQFYEIVETKVRKLSIKDEDGNIVSIFPSTLNFNISFGDREDSKREFEDKNFGFDWINKDLEIVLPDEYKNSNDEDDAKEMSWLLKANMFIKGHAMENEQITLMLDFLKRKNKVSEYQEVTFEIESREKNRANSIDELLA